MRTAKGTAGTYECGTANVIWKLNFGTESKSTVSITRCNRWVRFDFLNVMLYFVLP